MKNHFKSLGASIIIILVFSCSTEEKTIDYVLDNTQSGIILRNIEIESGEFDNDNPASANFSVVVEIQDTQNGGYTDKIKVYADYKDNNGTGNNRPETLIKTIESSNFIRAENRLLRTTISVTLDELKASLSLSNSQVNTCDVSTFRLEAIAKDGKVFTNTNSSSTVTGGSYFSSPFQYSVNVVGGVLTDSLAGNHSYTTTGMFIPGTASCGGIVTGTINWTETGTPGLYATNDMSFGLFESTCWSDTPAVSDTSQVKWFCKTLTGLGTDQYGSSWEYTIVSVVGPVLKLKFISSYSTGEGGTVTITREGGVNWPAIMQD